MRVGGCGSCCLAEALRFYHNLPEKPQHQPLRIGARSRGNCGSIARVSDWVQSDETLEIDAFAAGLGLETLTRSMLAFGLKPYYWVVGQGKDLGRFLFGFEIEEIKRTIASWTWKGTGIDDP